jgi:D-apiose dehydrogenase
VVHSSIVDAQRDILNGLRGGAAETTGEDNIKTVDLVWKAYESAETGQIIRFN